MKSSEQEQDEQYQESSEGKSPTRWGSNTRKYSRITPEVKDKLIFLIVRNNMSIKQAAQYLKINYSSAKFIFSQYRDRSHQCEQPAEGQKHEYVVRAIHPDEDDGIELRYTVGGKYEGESTRTLTVEEIHKATQSNAPEDPTL